MSNIKLSVVGKRPTQEEVDNNKPLSKTINEQPTIDAYFMQEISDRLYGPDAFLYIEELKKIHLKIRKRDGKYGAQFSKQS
jgi:hypothetical protein